MKRPRLPLSARVLGAPLAGALVLSGCVSGEDIQRLHQHLGDVEKKVESVAKQSSSKEEVAKLNENLGKQAATLLRSNADLGVKFDELTRELQSLAGKLEDANRRLTALSQQIGETQAKLALLAAGASAAPQGANPTVAPDAAVVAAAPQTADPRLAAPPAPPKPSPAAARVPSAADLYAQATADYQRGQYELARQGFEDYVATFPKTDLSDDSVYWIGECWAAQKKPKDAIAAFDRLIKLYPQSDRAATAHLKKGLAHLELGEKAQAIVQLQFVVHEFPGSDEAKSARQRLRTLGSDAR